ncbi:MAG: type III toxin-antitoxin system ToxN/AbiQ family toxin [Clostridiales bacterium]|nr:type III toxin-antitoxin system ToxN/AbiQ family toxin [Clostridiales bacterium]
MDKLDFFTVDPCYVEFVQKSEHTKRGFCRVPNITYTSEHRAKFVCGVVLQINNIDYYAPVSSFKQQKPDNFVIKAKNGKAVSSLRFNYMFPIPKWLVTIRSIYDEPDRAYRSLLSQELWYCIKNQDVIIHLAERTYRRVLLGKDKGLVENSCDFQLLEKKSLEYKAP